MTDRQTSTSGRVLITPENGATAFNAIITMADNPTNEGTAPNKANLLTDATEIAIWSGANDRTVNTALAALGGNVSSFGTCSTAAATAAKVATPSSSSVGFTRAVGKVIAVRFSYANTATSPTLNYYSTGAASIRDYRTRLVPVAGAMPAGTLFFMWDGSYWMLMNPDTTGRIETVSYAGTAAYGSNNPCTVSASFIIKAMLVGITGAVSYTLTAAPPWTISQIPMDNTYYSAYYYPLYNTSSIALQLKRSTDGKTVTWYSTTDFSYQLNNSGTTYTFILLG